MDSSDALDDKDSGPEVPLNFPSSVMSRIEELMGGTEQFDSTDFDAVSYINRVFPTEQSLSGVEGAVARAEFRLSGVATDIRRLVRAQAEQRERGQRALQDAQRCIAELALQVADVNCASARSEGTVREITAEIKQLDCAKSNLTAAITALNHFHMLVGGVDSLQAMTAARQYKEVVLPLQALVEVLQHFAAYRDIRPLRALHDQVQQVRAQLAQQILDDFRDAFTGGRSAVSHRTLAESCAVLDVLDEKVQQDLLQWFITMQLQEYRHLFSSEQECAWLAHVEKRYSWLKKHLLSFEQTLAALFPAHWRLSERIAQHFCKVTREDLSAIMSSRRAEVDVKLLLYAMQKTCSFEMLLHKRFVGTDGVEAASLESSGEGGVDGEAGSEVPSSPWVGAIGACFEPYMSLYINSLDVNLRSLMDRFIQEARSMEGGMGAGGAGAVMSSCADLFLFYKRCLVQCARLSHQPMLELAGVFQKYLREYATCVLQGALPAGGGAGAGAGTASSLVNNLHTLLRDEQANTHRYSKQELSRITHVITTAEYCLETTLHLETKLKEKVSAENRDRIDLTPEQELFHKVIDTCIQLLVSELELACSPALQAMTRVSWLHLNAVGDQSSYVTQIVMHLRNSVPPLRDNLASSRKYFTQFCIRFANSFIPKLIQNIYKCKPMSTVGSEQLLLDAHMLKTALLELPSLGSDVKRPAPHTYTKVVLKLMTKAEMILKLVMAPLEGNMEGFVSQFVQLLPECTVQEFHRVLDMKGARLTKAQLAALDQMFRQATSDK